jgi:hypothetical protein
MEANADAGALSTKVADFRDRENALTLLGGGDFYPLVIPPKREAL